jgi:hypothetical protein
MSISTKASAVRFCMRLVRKREVAVLLFYHLRSLNVFKVTGAHSSILGTRSNNLDI